MSDRTLVRILQIAALIGGSLAVIGSLVFFAVGHAGPWWSGFYAFLALFSLFFAVFVWFVIPQQPRNAVLWTMAASAFFGGLAVAGAAGAAMLVIDDPNLVLGDLLGSGGSVTPADLPSAAAWFLVFSAPAWVGTLVPLLTFGLLVFPDGRLPSPRWRWVGLLAAISILITTVAEAWAYRPWSTVPIEVVEEEGLLLNAGVALVVLAVLLSLVALVVRFRRSAGATRQQFKWVVWGAAIFVPALIASIAVGNTRYEAAVFPLLMVATGVFLGSYGIAVARYRLFDIDGVISRTLVYGTLVALLVAVYAAGVFLLRNLLPGGSDLAVAASTLAVAALFNPLRKRVQGIVDRSFYRSRYDAQRIVEEFSTRLGNEVDLTQLTTDWLDTVDRAVKPASASIWIRPGQRPQAHP